MQVFRKCSSMPGSITAKHGYMDDVIVAEMIKGIETEFKDEGRVLIRPSGTEPLSE